MTARKGTVAPAFNPTLWRQKQETMVCEYESSLVYIVNYQDSQSYMMRLVSNKQTNKL